MGLKDSKEAELHLFSKLSFKNGPWLSKAEKVNGCCWP